MATTTPPTLEEIMQRLQALDLKQDTLAQAVQQTQGQVQEVANVTVQTAQAAQAAPAPPAVVVDAPKFTLKPKAPEPFTGRYGVNVTSWLFRMHEYLRLAAIPEQQQVIWAASYLSDTASTWWRFQQLRTTQGMEAAITTWSDFARLLTKYFQPLNAKRHARNRLAQLAQKKSVREYNHAYTMLMIELPEMHEEDRLDRYIRGLKLAVRKELEVKDPEKLEDAMEMAERIDEFLYSNRRPSNERPSQVDRPTGPTPMELGAMQTQARTFGGKARGHDGRRAGSLSGNAKGNSGNLTQAEKDLLMAEGRCFKCKQPGHRGFECPSKATK